MGVSPHLPVSSKLELVGVMQNHLDSQRSFSAMLGADPMSFGPPGHEFTTLTSSHNNHHSPEFGHLLNANGGNPPLVNNNHNQQHNNNNNNSNTPNHNNNNADVKPKKAPPPNGKKTKGRVKIKMEFIDNKLRRYTTFSKRKTGIMKKVGHICMRVRRLAKYVNKYDRFSFHMKICK